MLQPEADRLLHSVSATAIIMMTTKEVDNAVLIVGPHAGVKLISHYYIGDKQCQVLGTNNGRYCTNRIHKTTNTGIRIL